MFVIVVGVVGRGTFVIVVGVVGRGNTIIVITLLCSFRKLFDVCM